MNKPPQNHKPPQPFYPCAYFACAEAGTLPADMLYWSDKKQGWYCADCFDHEDEERGVSLADWLEEWRANKFWAWWSNPSTRRKMERLPLRQDVAEEIWQQATHPHRERRRR